MASGGLMADVRSLTMKGDKLAVQGRGITPRPATPTQDLLMPTAVEPTSSRGSVTSDEDVSNTVEDEEANSMLRGVVSMNQVLEGQIEALRLRLQVEDKQHVKEKGKLEAEKDLVIQARDSEIEDLKDSLVSREERIHSLLVAGEEKNRTIQEKVTEIDELKKLVRQTEEYAHKLHKQIGRVNSEKKSLESDTLYKAQNDEIRRLTEELIQLKARLSDMETELHRASRIIEEQNVKIKELEQERGSMHDKFREELDKATKAMRQEVERMREVMRQNYDEMKQLRDQNKQMHSDVKDIKDMLLKTRASQPLSPSSPSPRFTGIQRPLTASPVHMFKPAEYGSPRGSPNPRGPNQGVLAAAAAGSRQPRPGGAAGGSVLSSRQSPDPPVSSRPSPKPQPAQPQPQQKGGGGARPPGSAKTGGTLPAICSVKDLAPSTPQPVLRTKTSIRQSAGKGVRK